MTVKINFTKDELETLLICVNDYRWVGDFQNDELEKVKRKLKYQIKNYKETTITSKNKASNKDIIEQWRSVIDGD